jgi:hypothetical protein
MGTYLVAVALRAKRRPRMAMLDFIVTDTEEMYYAGWYSNGWKV